MAVADLSDGYVLASRIVLRSAPRTKIFGENSRGLCGSILVDWDDVPLAAHWGVRCLVATRKRE